MSKLGQATNPLNGQKVDIFSFSSIWSNMLGVVFLIFIFWAGEKVLSLITGKTGVNVTPYNPVAPMPTSAPTNQVRVY